MNCICTETIKPFFFKNKNYKFDPVIDAFIVYDKDDFRHRFSVDEFLNSFKTDEKDFMKYATKTEN